MEELVTTYETIIKRLRDEKKFDLIKVIGIPITMPVFINTLFIGIGALVAAGRLLTTARESQIKLT